MKVMITQARTRWFLAAIVVLLLGAQVAQSAHIHADNHFTPDCAQCSVDAGQAITNAAATPYVPASTTAHPTVLAAPVASPLRPTGRGPPTLSN